MKEKKIIKHIWIKKIANLVHLLFYNISKNKNLRRYHMNIDIFKSIIDFLTAFLTLLTVICK